MTDTFKFQRYAKASKARGVSILRQPGVTKSAGPQ